jgi:putative redox protein
MVTSHSKKEKYMTEISNGKLTILSDTTTDKGGKGENFRPHDLLCAALASCLNITSRIILDRKQIKYDDVIIKVDLDRSAENKAKFIYHIDILGNIDDETKKKVITMVLRGCPVKGTLEKEISFEAAE